MSIASKSGGVVIHKSSHAICVVTNELGLHVLPKGSLTRGESYLEAAKREVYEETGLESLVLVRELGILERPGHSSAQSKHHDVVKRIHLYLFETDQDNLRPVLSDAISAEWIQAENLKDTLSWSEEFQFVLENCPELFA